MPSLNRLPHAFWLLMPTGTWPWSDATVHSHRYDRWWDENGQTWHSTLSYNFRLNDVLYVGHARWNDSAEPPTFERDEIIQIRYNPQNPDISFFPEKDPLLARRVLLAFAAGILVCIIVMVMMAHHQHSA